MLSSVLVLGTWHIRSSWARGDRVAKLEIQRGSGPAIQGVEMEDALASCSPNRGPCVKELADLSVVCVVVHGVQVQVHGVQVHSIRVVRPGNRWPL